MRWIAFPVLFAALFVLPASSAFFDSTFEGAGLKASLTRVLANSNTTYDATLRTHCYGDGCAAALIVLHADGSATGTTIHHSFEIDDVAEISTPLGSQSVSLGTPDQEWTVGFDREGYDISGGTSQQEVLIGFIARGWSEYTETVHNGTVLGTAASSHSEWVRAQDMGLFATRANVGGAAVVGSHHWSTSVGSFGLWDGPIGQIAGRTITTPEATYSCLVNCPGLKFFRGGPGDYSAGFVFYGDFDLAIEGEMLMYTNIAPP